jgi:hypothetical protein
MLNGTKKQATKQTGPSCDTKTIGAVAKPRVYAVIPSLYTISVTSQAFVNSAWGGEYGPAAYPASTVTLQEMVVIYDFRR